MKYISIKSFTITIVILVLGVSSIQAQKISAGQSCVLYICPDSTVSAIGHNHVYNVYTGYQLGDGTNIDRHIPVKVKGLHSVVAVNAMGCLALLKDGTVWQWAQKDNYSLKKINIDSVVAISSNTQPNGGKFYCALKSDGSLWLWGDRDIKNDYWWGYTDIPEKMDLPKVKKVAAGCSCVIALCEDGSVWTWGSDQVEGNGNLINYPTYQIYNPQKVTTISNVVDVIAGGFSNKVWALKNDGTVWEWGKYPKDLGISDIKKVFVGQDWLNDGLYAMKTDGTIIFYNSLWHPERVETIDYIKDIECIASTGNGVTTGGISSFILDSSGNLWRWGGNQYGQLGNFTTYPIDTPEVMPHKCMAVNCDTITKNPDVLVLDTTVRRGDPVTLKTSLSESDLYWWYPQSNVISGKYAQEATVKIREDTEFNTVVMDSYGCMRKERFMLRKKCPPLRTVVDTVTYPGATIPLEAGKSDYYYWNPYNNLSCNYCRNTVATITEPVTYTCTYTDSIGCYVQEKFVIRIRDCDTIVRGSNGLDSLITPGSYTTLTASSAETYSWTPATGLSCTSCKKPTARIYGNTEFTATMMDKLRCQWTERFKLTNKCDNSTLSNPRVVMDTVTYPQAQLSFTQPNGRDYVWQPTTGLSCGSCKNPTATVTNPVAYSVSMVDSFYCATKAQFNIRIRDCDTIVVQNNTVLLDTTIHYATTIPLLASESYTGYVWNPTVGLSCTDCHDPVLSVAKTAEYTVATYDRWRCPVSERYKITMVNLDVVIPNVFTPNGDGVNDYFEVNGLKPNSTLQILSSNEGIVFSSGSYDGSWNGTDGSGNSLPEGTYWYILDVPGAGKFTGWVYIKR